VDVSLSCCSAKVEAAGIEPASESLQLQPLHMLFRGQNSHPSNLPGRTREVLAWFKFRLLLLQAWEDGGYPTSWRPTPSPWASDGRTLAGLLGGQGYFIIVGDYVVFRFFTRPAESSACNCNLMNPRRNPFAPSSIKIALIRPPAPAQYRAGHYDV
jgi:hypothetical protein